MAMVWLVERVVMGLRFAGRSGRFAGFATFGHAHIRGLAQGLCSSHVRCLKSSAAAGLGDAQATSRGVGVREPGMLGPPR